MMRVLSRKACCSGMKKHVKKQKNVYKGSERGRCKELKSKRLALKSKTEIKMTNVKPFEATIWRECGCVFQCLSVCMCVRVSMRELHVCLVVPTRARILARSKDIETRRMANERNKRAKREPSL